MTQKDKMYPKFFYHVYHQAVGGENLFRIANNYAYFLRKYGEHISPIAKTYAYCLLPNHFHFLVEIRENVYGYYQEKQTLAEKVSLPEADFDVDRFISQQFQNFLNGYAQAYNKMYNRRGKLFQENVNRKLVNTPDYILQMVHYIHYNPVRHGFVKKIDDWTYTSLHAFLSEKTTSLERTELLERFGDKTIFLKYHQNKPVLGNELLF
jgi:putative transposase